MEESEGKHKSEQALEHNQSAVLTYLRIVNTGVGQKRNPDNNVRM